MKIKVYVLSIVVLLLFGFFINDAHKSVLPILWMGYGFVYHGILYVKDSYRLSHLLITKHRNFLIQNKISFTENRFAKRIDTFTLLQERQQLALISKYVKQKITDIRTNLYLAIISFFLFPIFIWIVLR